MPRHVACIFNGYGQLRPNSDSAVTICSVDDNRTLTRPLQSYCPISSANYPRCSQLEEEEGGGKERRKKEVGSDEGQTNCPMCGPPKLGTHLASSNECSELAPCDCRQFSLLVLGAIPFLSSFHLTATSVVDSLNDSGSDSTPLTAVAPWRTPSVVVVVYANCRHCLAQLQ